MATAVRTEVESCVSLSQTAGPGCGNRSLAQAGSRTDLAASCDAKSANGGRGYHPRCNRKSSEHVVSKRDSRAPLRQRVRKRMKTLSLQGCNRKERTWTVLVS